MRYLVGFVLLLLALGTFRVVGCGDERIPCETAEECDDENECTDDFCDRVDDSLGYCRNTEVGYGLYNPLPVFCDLDGVEQFYEDGICVSRTCERREPSTDQYMCSDYICNRASDVYPIRNPCTNDFFDEGTCTYVLEPNGSPCCAARERYDCTIGGGCQYRCTGGGECQDGQCCVELHPELDPELRCYESRPWGYGCD
jgi:hypothetical protein